MKKIRPIFIFSCLIFLLTSFSLPIYAEEQPQYIYDDAGLLSNSEKQELESLAQKLGEEDDIAFIVLTINETGIDIEDYVNEFQEIDNRDAFILGLDMKERDVYVDSFNHASIYAKKNRLKSLRQEITPDLSEGHYARAFSNFMNLAHEYMSLEPEPESNLLYEWWFQLAAAIILASVSVGLIAYRSGGRVTVNGNTYMNHSTSRVVNQYDRFIRKTVTKQKKPSQNNNSGFGGGGSISGGGSRGKF